MEAANRQVMRGTVLAGHVPAHRLVRRRRSAALRVLIVPAVIVCGLSVPPGVVFAKAPLGQQWPATQQVSFEAIDHAAFDALLRKYVDPDGYVDYQAWHASAADRAALQQYLLSLSRGTRAKSSSRPAELAFWINAYNAVTLEGILQEYPTSSIRNHTAKVAGYNIWKDLPLLVGGEAFSLDAMEHQVLRKFGEPRIHFAIVCASVGCPRLRNEAYVSSRLEEQLADNTRDFFSRPQNLQVEGATLQLSSILEWFGSDFGASQRDQLQAIRPYLPQGAQQVVQGGSARVAYLNYDWSLNDQRTRR